MRWKRATHERPGHASDAERRPSYIVAWRRAHDQPDCLWRPGW
jgi:hypothetical protein